MNRFLNAFFEFLFFWQKLNETDSKFSDGLIRNRPKLETTPRPSLTSSLPITFCLSFEPQINGITFEHILLHV